MLFTGYTELTIDAKGRLAIPAKYRNKWDPKQHGGAWYCVPWPGGVLRLFPEAQFEAMAEQLEDSLMQLPEEAELDVNFFGHAERLEPDAQGRVLLPRRHIALAELPSEVAVVGARNRLEVRARDSWTESEPRRLEGIPGQIQRIRGLRSAVEPAGSSGSQGASPEGE